MITVNSVSGGRTSSFMALHYPADKNVFALVLLNQLDCAPKDKGLIKRVSDKLGFDFIATAEDDLTLVAMLDLEQLIGKEIDWVAGRSFDSLVSSRKHLPNKEWRYCTKELKIRPIKKYCKKFGVVEMNIGFRFDEKERAENFMKDQDWRVVNFPLVKDRIGHYTVHKWVKTTNLVFPEDSNCVGCFWKPLQQLRKNYDTNPPKMNWFENQENKKRRWKSDITYNTIKSIGLQSEFIFGTGSGCQAGFCSD